MLFGKADITAKELAEKLVSGVMSKMGSYPPPRDGGKRPKWTRAVKAVFHEMGSTLGYDNWPEWCSLDCLWWTNAKDKSKDSLVLVAESELENNVNGVENDFLKLRLFKCPLKVLVFSADVDEVKRMAETDLQLYEQHVSREEYLLVGFTASGPRCFHFEVPQGKNGKLNKVVFKEFRASRAASMAA